MPHNICVYLYIHTYVRTYVRTYIHTGELAHYPPVPQNIVSPLSTFTLPLPRKTSKISPHMQGETSCVKFMVNNCELAHYPPMGSPLSTVRATIQGRHVDSGLTLTWIVGRRSILSKHVPKVMYEKQQKQRKIGFSLMTSKYCHSPIPNYVSKNTCQIVCGPWAAKWIVG